MEWIEILINGIVVLSGTIIAAHFTPKIKHKYNQKLQWEVHNQILSQQQFEHENKIEQIRTELIFKEKIESLKKIEIILPKIRYESIDVKIGKSSPHNLIVLKREILNQSLLFSSPEIISKINALNKLVENVIDNPLQIQMPVDINSVLNSPEMLGFVKEFGDSQVSIINAMKRELGIL